MGLVLTDAQRSMDYPINASNPFINESIRARPASPWTRHALRRRVDQRAATCDAAAGKEAYGAGAGRSRSMMSHEIFMTQSTMTRRVT